MPAARNPSNRQRRPGALLKPPSRAVLRHLAVNGPQSKPQLLTIVDRFELSKLARECVIYNLQTQGYTERTKIAGLLHWQLTELGRSAVSFEATQAPAQSTAPHAAAIVLHEPAATPAPQPGARTVVWASRQVALPKAPRSVFELGAAL